MLEIRPLMIAATLVAMPQTGQAQITDVWDSRAPITLFRFGSGFERFVQNYYRRPNPAAAIVWYGRLDIASVKTNTAATVHAPQMLSAFYSVVIGRRRGTATDLARAAIARRSSKHVAIAYAAIWHARPPDRAAAIQLLENAMSPSGRAYMRRAYRTIRATPVLAMTPDRPWKLDVVWAAYFASGDRRYLRKIAGTLDYWLPKERFFAWVQEVGRANRNKPANRRRPDERTWRRLTAMPAYLYLRNNAHRHPAIIPVVRRVAQTSSGAKRAAAVTILRELGQR